MRGFYERRVQNSYWWKKIDFDSRLHNRRTKKQGKQDKFIYLDDDDFIWMNGAIKKITHHRSFKDFAGASFQYLFCYPLGSVPFP